MRKPMGKRKGAGALHTQMKNKFQKEKVVEEVEEVEESEEVEEVEEAVEEVESENEVAEEEQEEEQEEEGEEGEENEEEEEENEGSGFEGELEFSDEDEEENEEEEELEEEEEEEGEEGEEEVTDEFAGGKEMIFLDPKTKSTVDSKLAKFDKHTMKTGVVYLGRIPHGFYEDQIRGFLSQFGDITRLRLSRNKKTGKSKFYAFVEFEFEEVARIVVETLNNYLIFGHVLKCSMVPEDKIVPGFWRGANKVFKPKDWKSIQQNQRDRQTNPENLKKRAKKISANNSKKRKLLKELGIDYDFGEQVAPLSKHVRYE